MIFRLPCPRRPRKPESVSRREELVSTRGRAYHYSVAGSSPSSSAVTGPSADGPDCLDDQTQTGQTGRAQGDGTGSTQPLRPVGECHAAGSVPFEPNGLNPDLGADDGMFRALIDRREPARIVGPVDHQVARP